MPLPKRKGQSGSHRTAPSTMLESGLLEPGPLLLVVLGRNKVLGHGADKRHCSRRHANASLQDRIEWMRRAKVDVGVFVDRKSTRLNSSHANISYAVFCL